MCTMPLTYVATDPKIFVRLISELEPLKKDVWNLIKPT